MPCPVSGDIEMIIECDRKMIRTYLLIYGIVAAATVGIALYLSRHTIGNDLMSKLIEKLIEVAVGSFVVPVAMLHLKRKSALTPFLVMRMRGQQHKPGEPECAELKELVNEALKKRMEA